jgi:thymidylate synthase
MRIYIDVNEAFEEVKRDLMEMGIEVKPKSMQDKDIEGNTDYYTKELQNYSYSILAVKPEDVPRVTQPWADAEFEERVMDPIGLRNYYDDEELLSKFGINVEKSDEKYTINPGKAYKLRDEVWNEFLHDGEFGYTYNERINHFNQLNQIINRIKKDPGSRQLWLSLWDPSIDPAHIGGKVRVPCSLGYNFQVREGKLNIHYIMRSCDFATHFPNDVYLSMKLLQYIAEQTGYPVGSFTHTIFSLHVYNKDVEGVF